MRLTEKTHHHKNFEKFLRFEKKMESLAHPFCGSRI